MEKYTVQAGDSLWKISRNFTIDINELYNINGLNTKAEQHIIQPGQILTLPSKDKIYDTQLTLKIYDLAWRSLNIARLKLTFDGKIHDFVTDGAGSVAGLLIENSTKGIKVELQHLNKKEYILIADHKQLPLGKKTLKISSREMIMKGSTSVEKGTQQSSKQQEKEKAKQENKAPSTKSNTPENKPKENIAPTINQTTRTEGGTPTSVSNIGNVSEGLRLPKEAEKYRNFIIETAKKYNFLPEGLAALIYAESRWKSDATNTVGSGAVGLGQFKPDTWLPLCTSKESKVYKFLTSKYSYKDITYKDEKIFGTLDDSTSIEINKDTLLALRVNAEYNIDMIGVYSQQSISYMEKRSLPVSSLNSDEIIKLIYFSHMNGGAGAYDIIMNKKVTNKKYKIYPESSFENRLKSNLKNAKLENRYHSIDGTFRTAFISWMVTFYDSTIVPDHFRVKPNNKNYSTKDIIKKLNSDFDVNTDLPPLDSKNMPSTSKPNNPLNNGAAGAAGATLWHNPLDLCRIRTHGLRSARSASFGRDVRTDSHGNPKAHQGIDIEAEPGTPIKAVADGRIAFITNPSQGDYGKQLCMIVQADDLPVNKSVLCIDGSQNITEIYFFYAHLSEISTDLSTNKPVKCGDVLGKTGHTGNAAPMTSIIKGAHLHFEVRTLARTGRGILNHLNPAPFIDNFNYPEGR